MRKILTPILMVAMMVSFGQTTFPKNGVADERPEVYAFTNATIFQDYQTKVENATLVIEQGKIVAVGSGVNVPSGAIVIDLKGKSIYPSFVDIHTSYGLPKTKRAGRGTPQYDSNKPGAYAWNEAIKADYNAIEEFKVDKEEAKALRKAGFGTVVSFRDDGIFRGSSVLVTTGDQEAQTEVISPRASAHLSFDKGSSRQLYPTSIMGYSALIRQTYYDAKWYATDGYKEQTNQSLADFNNLKSLPQIFESRGSRATLMLADKLGDEFGIQYIIKGNGDEYQRIDDIKSTNANLIIPVNFPKAYDVSDPLAALDISTTDLKHWELAPSNPAAVANAGITFSLTADGLNSKDVYLKNVRKAVKNGLNETHALKAMTYTPAMAIGKSNMIGSLKPGYLANFLITSSGLFEDGSKIEENWVQGRRYQISDINEPDFSGTYKLTLGGTNYDFSISGKSGSHKGEIVENDTTKTSTTFSHDMGRVNLMFTFKDADGAYRLSGWVSQEGFSGNGQDPTGNWIDWSANKDGESEDDGKTEEKDKVVADKGSIIFPWTAFGWTEKPKAETILFQNATVWTMEGDGREEATDVLVKNGKISAVGTGLSADGAKAIDATGMHLSPGVIDEHSHIGLSGVNESSHAVTAEVRMYDAIDADDIDIYRQLSGGTVAAQLLHGSANPVGGQSALVKFRWGSSAEEMKIKGADEYIKFALGENVKQSNRSREWVTRFPQTRMGVEQVFVDAFTRAKAYDKEWRAYNALPSKTKAKTTSPRRDLQLESLAEILNSERFITCHSYVQSEINMLMKVAEQFDFKVNTFTHILEGYKVADKMAKHGVGGSTFSDWWAYKYEVKEAIPYNAALMKQAGVTVAINSDNAEMARRLNQEAGKSIKYGGMDEVEALKMVTLNPAKLLHLDDRMGSIKVGKDADLVLWTDHPLSVYAKAQMTLVDGIVYFDRDQDLERRSWMQQERTRLINSMKKDGKENGTQKYKAKEKHEWHCSDFDVHTLND